MATTSVSTYFELSSLLYALGRSDAVRDLEWVGRYLARMAGRPGRPWSYRYLLGCLRGYDNVKPSIELHRTILAALAVIEDGMSPTQAMTQAAEVLAPPGSDVAGALVSGKVLDCKTPGCPNRFIPNASRRTHCYVCSPEKTK
jgi:hypothetical protein